MHRVLFHRHHKRELVYSASRVALGGQVLLALAVATSVLFVTDYLYSHVLAGVMAFVVLVWTSVWFFVLPLYIRATHHRAGDATTSST